MGKQHASVRSTRSRKARNREPGNFTEQDITILRVGYLELFISPSWQRCEASRNSGSGVQGRASIMSRAKGKSGAE